MAEERRRCDFINGMGMGWAAEHSDRESEGGTVVVACVMNHVTCPRLCEKAESESPHLSGWELATRVTRRIQWADAPTPCFPVAVTLHRRVTRGRSRVG